MAEIARDFFVYDVDFLALAFGTAATNALAIQADSDFVLQKLCCRADIAAGGQVAGTIVVPLCTVLITDTGSGRQLMNQAIDLNTFFGTGENPFILPQPKVFRSNTLINITVANYSAGTAYNVHLAFIGVKSFQGG